MTTGEPGSEDSGEVPAREEAPPGGGGTWSPRRSLGARLVLYLLPVAVLPAFLYWLVVDRETDRNERQLLETLLADAQRQEAQALRAEADDAVRVVGDAARKLATIVRRAAVETARARSRRGRIPNVPPRSSWRRPGRR